MKNLKLILIGFLLTSCNYMELYNVPGQQGENGSNVGEQCAPVDPTTLITYDTLRADVLQSKCIGCHSASSPRGGVDLSSYMAAKPLAQRIQFVVERGTMPRPPVTMTAEEKQKVITWVQQGALNSATEIANCEETGQNPTGPTVPTPPEDELVLTKVPPVDQINFKLVKEKILQMNCIACHSNSGGNRGKVNLETYENVTDEMDDVLEQVEMGMMPPGSRP